MMSWGGVMGWGVIEEGWRKGPWTAEEDRLLIEYVRLHGEGRWNSVARLAGIYHIYLLHVPHHTILYYTILYHANHVFNFDVKRVEKEWEEL